MISILSSWMSVVFLLESLADPKDMPIRMAKVHLPDMPRHVRRRKRHLQPGRDALFVQLVHVLHPSRHPNPLIAPLVVVLLKGRRVRATTATSLCPLAKKDVGLFARTNCAEGWRLSPVPQLFPSPLFKPRKCTLNIRHIQDRSHAFHIHS